MAHALLDVHGERFEFEAVDPISSDVSVADSDEMELDTTPTPSLLRIAIDFGTTFTSVAYARTPASQQSIALQDIACVAPYPGDRPLPTVTQAWQPRQDVPTELWYGRSTSTGYEGENHLNTMQQGPQSDSECSDSESNHSTSTSSFEANNLSVNQLNPPITERDRSFGTIAWGFEVQHQFTADGTDLNRDKRISRFKLLLDRSKDASDKAIKARSDTISKLEKLKKLKLITLNTDVITHFLGKLFLQIQTHLQQNNELVPSDNIEFIICVPAEWPSKACRDMQNSMSKAAERSGLGRLRDGTLENLFIVSEPEAAAACILEENRDRIFRGEAVVILDAGGGTVDAVTYKITNSDPLRMSAEIVPPKTKLCGASYINEEYEKFLLKKLKNETYLVDNGRTIRGIIDQLVIEFENVWKRIWDMHDPNCVIQPVEIHYLRGSQTDRQLQQNRLVIDKKDVKKFFRRSLQGAVEVLENQLEMAKARGERVQKVILTGGFGQSPYLRSELRRFLAKQLSLDQTRISLVVSTVSSSTAVARGAILRASNKNLGPTRISSCCYGFLSSEPHEPTIIPAHQGIRAHWDRVDGEKYVDNTIRWLFQKGEELEVGKQESIIVRHTFRTTRKHLICKEVLYVSDIERESHYRIRHPKNQGAEIAGSVSVDMTFLRDEGHIKPEPVSDLSKYASKKKEMFVVEFELVIRVDGRNLVYEARWPIHSKAPDAVKARGQTCIAATFKPGTA